MNRSTWALVSSLLLWCSPAPRTVRLSQDKDWNWLLHISDSSNTGDVSAPPPAPRPRARGSDAAHPLLRDLCLQESGGEGLGLRPNLKSRNPNICQRSNAAAHLCCGQTKSNTSVMPEFGKNPAADWNDPVIHVKPSQFTVRLSTPGRRSSFMCTSMRLFGGPQL